MRHDLDASFSKLFNRLRQRLVWIDIFGHNFDETEIAAPLDRQGQFRPPTDAQAQEWNLVHPPHPPQPPPPHPPPPQPPPPPQLEPQLDPQLDLVQLLDRGGVSEARTSESPLPASM